MAYILKLDKIYKQIRRDPDTEHPGGRSTLIPIRNLYVGGTHTEAVYMDHYLSINTFDESIPLKVADYTTRNEEAIDKMGVTFLGMDRYRSIRFDTYTVSSIPDQTDHTGVKFLGIDKYRSVRFESYQTEYIPDQIDHTGVKFLGIDKYKSIRFTSSPYTTTKTNDGPTHSITITEFDATALTITNGG